MNEDKSLDKDEEIVDISAFFQDKDVPSAPILYSPTRHGNDLPVADTHLITNSNQAINSAARTEATWTGDWMAQNDGFCSEFKDWEEKTTNTSALTYWGSDIGQVDFAKERALRDYYKAQTALATHGATEGLTSDEIFALELARANFTSDIDRDFHPLIPMSPSKQQTSAWGASYALIQVVNTTKDHFAAQQAHLASGPKNFESADAEIAYRLAMEDVLSPISSFDSASASPTAPAQETATNDIDIDINFEPLIYQSTNMISRRTVINTSSSDSHVADADYDEAHNSVSASGTDDEDFPVFFDDVPRRQYPDDPKVREMCKRVCREAGRRRNHEVCWVRNISLSTSPDNPHSNYTQGHNNGTRDSLKIWYARHLEVDFGYAEDASDPDSKPRETAVIYVGPGDEIDPTRMGLWRKDRAGDEVVWNQDAMLLLGEHVSD